MSPLRTKSRIPIYLRFVALIASLAAVAGFSYSQVNHDNEMVLTADLGHHMVTPATATVSQSSMASRTTALLILLQTQYAFIWSLIIIPIELSTPVALHPGIYVAFDLLAWTTVTVGVVLYLLFMWPYYTGDGYTTCGRDYPDCESNHVAAVEHFATAMALLVV